MSEHSDFSKKWLANIDYDKEYILCAAIHYKGFPTPANSPFNIDEGVVLCGWRHHNIIGQCSSIMSLRQAEVGEYCQGFLTNTNRFVDRLEAMKIALNAKQVTEEKLGNPRIGLFSEDLY